MPSFFFKLWKLLRLPTNWQLFLMRQVNDQFLIGVTGIIFNKDSEVLLFKHTYRDKDHWSLPGGYIKAKEHPKEALEREIKEESGMTVSADDRLKLRTDRKTARFDISYTGIYIGGEFVPSKEVSEAKFFAFDQLPEISGDQLYFIDKAVNIRSKSDNVY